jgi:hypothetical protein
MLKQTVFDTAKLIPNPKSSELKAGIHTVLDTWNKTQKKFETYEPRWIFRQYKFRQKRR